MRFHDEPISKPEDDLLNRRRFADQLARAILAWPSGEPLTVGIYGRWGDGKSSVMQLLEAQLLTSCAVVKFDPWYFNSSEELIRIFVSAIFETVTERLPWISRTKLRRSAAGFARTLTSLPISLGFAGISLNFKDAKSDQPNPNTLKLALNKSLTDRRKYDKRKVVVLIDNLDRLPPSEILLMLKLVRLCTDFQDFVYVLAFDDRYVIRAIERELATEPGLGFTGEEYLRKIVQTDVHLPAIDLKAVDKFIDKALNELAAAHGVVWPPDFEKRFPAFYQDNVRGKIIRNLRDAKTFANAVAFSLPLVVGEVNYTDWLVVEVLRAFCPTSYGIVRDNAKVLAPDASVIGYHWAESERTRVQLQFQRIVDSFNSQCRDFSVSALDFLFPIFHSRFKDTPRLEVPSASDYAAYTAQQRITSSEYRDAFFQFGVVPGSLPDTFVTKFIDDMCNAPISDVTARFAAALEYAKSEQHVTAFFDKLLLRAGSIIRERDASLVQAIARHAPNYSTQRDYWIDSESDRARATIFAILAQNEDAQKLVELIDITIAAAGNDEFAVGFVIFMHPRHNRIFQRFDLIDRDRMNKALRSRLVSTYISGGADIFERVPTSYSSILSQWAGPLLNDQQNVQEYLSRLFKTSPRYVGQFLNRFMQTSPFSDGTGSRHFSLKDFSEAFSPKWMSASMAALVDPTFSSLDEKEAVEAFLATQSESAALSSTANS